MQCLGADMAVTARKQQMPKGNALARWAQTGLAQTVHETNGPTFSVPGRVPGAMMAVIVVKLFDRVAHAALLLKKPHDSAASPDPQDMGAKAKLQAYDGRTMACRTYFVKARAFANSLVERGPTRYTRPTLLSANIALVTALGEHR